MHQRVKWNNGFEDFQMALLPAPQDGSCLYHAICNGFYIGYRTENIGGYHISRHNIVTKLREELALRLEEVDPDDILGRTRYELLSNGNIKELGDSGYTTKSGHSYTLEGMKSWLNSSSSMGEEVITLITSVFRKSIYFLDTRTKDVYSMSEIPPDNFPAIVLFYNGGHYDLAAIIENDNSITTHFAPTHTFVEYIRARLLSLKSAP